MALPSIRNSLQAIFGGLEFSMRDLNIPFEFIDALTGVSEVRRGDGKEYLGRTYLFWTPHKWLALSAEYQYERFKNDQEVAFSFKNLTTHRVPLGLKFFHPSGLGALLKATYFNQSGDFIRRGGVAFESGRSNFWVVDAGISYRLPQALRHSHDRSEQISLTESSSIRKQTFATRRYNRTE